MTRGEYFLCRLMAADTGKAAPDEGIRFYKKCGFTDPQIELYKARFGGFGKAIAPLPQSYDRLVDGELGQIGGREWRVVIGSGHSPEHACLYCPELNLALTGDQLLPNISSNVSVWPTEPESNPLEDWIQQTARHLAMAVVAACSVIDFEAAIIDGDFPAEVRQRIVDATQAEINRLDLRGLKPPETYTGAVGRDARALGAASLPLFARYLLDQSVLFKELS